MSLFPQLCIVFAWLASGMAQAVRMGFVLYNVLSTYFLSHSTLHYAICDFHINLVTSLLVMAD